MKNFASIALWLLFLITVVPVGILAFYNHPSVADDYCFAYMTRDVGFWQAQKFYYEGWSGRYISNMIFHATPLAFGVFWFVKVMPFLILGLLYHAMYSLIGELLKPSRQGQLLSAATLLSLFIIFSSSVVDTFYWYTSVFIFPTSLCYFLYLIVVILRYYQPKYQKIKYPIALLAATLVFFMVGSNEVMMLFILVFLGMIWLYILVFEKRFDGFIFFLMMVGAYFAYFWVIKAKGNEIRMAAAGGQVFGGAIVQSIKNALESTFWSTINWVKLLLPALILYKLVFLKRYYVVKDSAFLNVHIWVLNVALCVLVFLMFFVIHYGNDMGVPDRVNNIIFAIFMIGIFFIVTVIHYQYPTQWEVSSMLKVFGFILYLLMFTVSIPKSTSGQNLKTMYADIRLGIAKRYDQEMTQRYNHIMTSKTDTIYVAPLKNIPKSLCFDEIKTNEQHLWNKCYATYFGKKVIILKEEK
ncbi:hypothetical protein VB796_14080 [Arcicella sp. LKC2W]|uniref:hypothetical protein n=1 Tax=Arcicella sp. LKC2W TaxID=2984198 RepID=UPI002B206902|nr:hypothetical protein [Arcicella sp. LKC2W]MEA5460181.1 hypothetical protein [Arcicella sp. LKC2W]